MSDSQKDLIASIRNLESRIESLELAASRQKVGSRRNLTVAMAMALVLVAGAGLGHLADSKGATLLQFMDYSSPHVVPPPLDTMVRWQRRDVENAPVGSTNQIISLIADANQKNSHTWPLYIQLAATSSPDATQATSGSVGAYVRAFNRSAGSPWVTGYHSELYHGYASITGPQVEANGTSILYNGEMLTKSRHGVTIGLNLQNTVDSTGPATHAINIQAANALATWQNGIHFDGRGVAGNVGINFDVARFQNMGIDLGDNSIKLNAGQKIYLDSTGKTYLWCNTGASRIEIVRAGQRVAAW